MLWSAERRDGGAPLHQSKAAEVLFAIDAQLIALARRSNWVNAQSVC